MLYRKYTKRIVDIILALVGLIVLSPVFLQIALLIKINFGYPIIFKQERPGLKGKIFTLYKFRTMTDERDSQGELLPDRERLSDFGRLLRSTSLDELPELWNIILGDMGIVGPRPLLVQYLPLYNDHQKKRHNVRPGLTGLAQISGRNELDWERRFEMDVYYVENLSFIMDIKIFIETLKMVILRKGISSVSSDTMDKYQGYK